MMHFDTIIIGGGPAGAMAAGSLAGKGQKVLILEKAPLPHHKVCGEFVSCEATSMLASLGINLAAEGAAKIDQLRLIHGRKETHVLLPFEGLSVSRFMLDELLLNQTSKIGATVRRGLAATSVVANRHGWEVGCKTNEQFRSRHLFLATGKQDLRGWPRQGVKDDYIGFKMHYALSSLQQRDLNGSSELYLFDGGYAGLEMIEQKRANFCLVIKKRAFARYGKSWVVLKDRIIEAIPRLKERFLHAVPLWPRPLSIFGVPYGFLFKPSNEEQSGVFRIGDQMAVIPSFCGDGLAIALRTGLLAAECCLGSDANTYHRNARLELGPQIRYAQRLATVLGCAPLHPLILTLSRWSPSLVAHFVTRTRLSNGKLTASVSVPLGLACNHLSL